MSLPEQYFTTPIGRGLLAWRKRPKHVPMAAMLNKMAVDYQQRHRELPKRVAGGLDFPADGITIQAFGE